MLLYLKRAGVLALMFLAATPVLAQGPGGGGGRGGFGGGGFGGRSNSQYTLLQNEAVQKDLELSDDQKSKLTGLVESYREATRGERPQGSREEFQNLSREEMRERFASMAKAAEERTAKANAEFKPKFAEVLDEAQQQRLQQIYWQTLGSRKLQDPELSKSLKLSPEQQTKLTTLLNENNQGGFGGPGGGRGRGPGAEGNQDREARMAEFRARREKFEADVNAVLTDDQKSELTNLLGAEFDTAQLRQGGPGGRGGDRGRGEGGPRRGNGI